MSGEPLFLTGLDMLMIVVIAIGIPAISGLMVWKHFKTAGQAALWLFAAIGFDAASHILFSPLHRF